MKKITISKQFIALLLKLLAIIKKQREYNTFKDTLGLYESGNNYQIVNTLGYMGKYQFGMARLSDLGYTERINGTTGFAHTNFRWVDGHSAKSFLYTPSLQEEAFDKHFGSWKRYILSKYSNIIGEYRYGVKLTVATMFVACHFGGSGGLSRFLQGSDSHDAYGNSLAKYMKKFEGFNV